MFDPPGATVRIEPETHDRITKILHWSVAVLIFTQFTLALVWERVDRPVERQLVWLHVSLGTLLIVLIIARIAWRIGWGSRLPRAPEGLPGLLAHGVHMLLYVMMVTEVLAGLSKRWGRGRAVDFFGVVQIPSPFPGPFPPGLRAGIDTLHEYLGWAIVILALGHAAVAILHRVVLKDRVLQRMTG